MNRETQIGSLLALDLTAQGALLAVFREGRLLQARFLKGKELARDERYRSILRVEIQRTLAFHKEKYKGESIERILATGPHARFLNLEEEGNTFLSGRLLPLPVFQGEEEVECEPDRPLLTLLAGLLLCRAKRGRRNVGIDFSLPARKTALAAACILLFTALSLAGILSVTQSLKRENQRIALDLQRLRHETSDLDLVSRRYNRMQALSKEHEKLNSLLAALESPRRNVSESILFACKHLPPGAELVSIHLLAQKPGGEKTSPEEKRFVLELKGDFTGAGTQSLLAFLQCLQGSNRFRNVQFRTGGIHPDAAGQGQLTETVCVEAGLP